MKALAAQFMLSVPIELEEELGIEFLHTYDDDHVENVIEGILTRFEEENQIKIEIDDGGNIIFGPKEIVRWIWKKLKKLFGIE